MTNNTPKGSDPKSPEPAGESNTFMYEFPPQKTNIKIALNNLSIKGVIPGIINRLAKLNQNP